MSYISALKQGDKVFVWEKDENNNRKMVSHPAPYYFYIESKSGEYKSLDGKTLARFDFEDGYNFYNTKKLCIDKGLTLYESDIAPELKLLSDKYYGADAPKLNVTMYDIEVDYDTSIGFSSPSNPYAPVNAIAMFHEHKNQMVVIVIPPKNANCDVPELGKASKEYIEVMNDITPIIEGVDVDIFFVATESELLLKFLNEIEDSDVICGWNNSGFDDPYMGKRIEKVLGKKHIKRLCFNGAPAPKWREVEVYGKEQPVIDLYGRVSLDYLTLFKKYMIENQASYKLDNIADKFLRTDNKPDMPKLDYQGSLADLYRNDFNYFIRYNIRDTEILHGFENKLRYVSLANEMVHRATGQFTHVAGTIKLAELSVINYCHHELNNTVVNDKSDTDWGGEKIKGAIVLDPDAGMHEWLSSVDLNSLYPSALRACNISPETKIGQFYREESAFESIRDKTDEDLSFEHVDGSKETHTASEWREILKERNHCISGFGTVFTLDFKGVIPSILEHWYASRKTYQKDMNIAKQAAEKLLKTCDSGDIKRKGVMMSDTCASKYDELTEIADYNDRLQYVFKILLNSFYGALSNQHFKFGDRALGESTTAIGRHVVTHQHRKVNELLTGDYNEFGEGIIYGDSVAGDTVINIEDGDVLIEDLFTHVNEIKNNKEYCNINKIKSLTYNEELHQNEYRDILYVVRHKVDKKMYRITLPNGNYVDVTEDHSVMNLNSEHRLVETKSKEIKHVLSKHNDSFLIDTEFSVSEINSPSYVYDIEVDTTHMFYGNGVLLHNTDSTYFHTYTENTEEAREIGDAIAEQVNKSFIPWMKKTFLVDRERAEIIKCGREIVADRGIFVMKKKYMLHLTDLDGYEVDKLKVMGLDTKRTTIPKEISIKLEKFIERLLKGETWDQIEQDIVDYKDEILSTENILEIGIPSGINKLEQYTREYRGDPKTRLPSHVAAAILYNRMRKENDDNTSPEITSGTKIKRFHLKQPYERFKAIALPTDMSVFEIPKWFWDFEINREEHIEKLIDAPINNVIKAIGEVAPTKQSMKFKSLFDYE